MKPSHKNTVIIIALPVIVIVAVIALVSLTATKPPIPSSITKRISFTVLQPDPAQFPITKSSAKYDDSQGILTYQASSGNTTLTVTEQQIPDSFSHAPQI